MSIFTMIYGTIGAGAAGFLFGFYVARHDQKMARRAAEGDSRGNQYVRPWDGD